MEGMVEQLKDQFDQLRSQFDPWLNQAIEYSRQVPPTQLYAAIAVLLFTTLLLLFGKYLSFRLNNDL